MSLSKIKYYFFSAAVSLLFFSSVNAAANKPIEIKFLGVSVQERATRAIEFLLSLAGGITLLLVIVSGIFFMVSMGNPEAQKKAKGMLIGTLTGLVVILFSYSFIYYADRFLV